MTMPEILSAADACYAYNMVLKHYEWALTPDYGPQLEKDWEKTWDADPEHPTLPWAIVWEDGPDDWAISVSHAEIIDKTRVFAEPGNGWVLALCRP